MSLLSHHLHYAEGATSGHVILTYTPFNTHNSNVMDIFVGSIEDADKIIKALQSLRRKLVSATQC